MRVAEVHELIDRVAAVETGCRERGELAGAVAAAARVRSWLDGQDVRLARQVAEVAPDPERTLVEASRCSRRQANRTLERAATADALPAVRNALDAGTLSGEHLDVLGRAWRRLEPHQQPHLAARAPRLVVLAGQVTPGELDRAATTEVRRIRTDDGLARLARQQAAARCRSWIDGEGMWCLTARFDPETGLRLDGRLTATIEALSTDDVPADCPSDPLERQGFLRAHALAQVIEHAGDGSRSRPEIVVVVDTVADAGDGGPVVDWGLPVELPIQVLHRLYATAEVNPVILCNGAVVHTPGQLDLGRSTRLANRAQRRALRALYPTCAIPGCDVPFAHCRIHHVRWWEHGGPTDLVNLLPLCSIHHHAVHDRCWQLTLTADRQLTITYPDGTTEILPAPPRTHGPHQIAPSPPPVDGAPPNGQPLDVPQRR